MGKQPGDITLGELNGDGKIDIAVGLQEIPSSGGTSNQLPVVSILLSKVANNIVAFDDAQTLIGNAQTTSIEIIDLDGDGKNDIATTNYSSIDKVNTFRNISEVNEVNCSPNCIPPTFLNTQPIVGNATCSNNDGQISIIPQSGTAPYQYSINGGSTYVSGANAGYTFFNLPAGTYQLKLKDANGCESAVVVRQVSVQACPPTTCTSPTFLNTLPIVGDATCGNNDGQVSIIPTSGTGPFMYSLNGGTTYEAGPDVGYTVFNLAAGTYQLKLKDVNGCESETIERTIESINCPTCTPPTFLNTLPIIGDATCGKSDGQISIIPTSGTGPFMYSIDGGSTYVAGPNAGYTFFNLPAGMYQLQLKAGNGCESTVVTRDVKMINCPSSTPTIAGASKGFAFDENGLDSKLKVLAYPNPSKGRFKLQVLQSVATKAEVFIYDGKGTLVQQASINPAKGSTIDVNLSGKAKGMYHMKVVTQKGISTSKILLQ